MADWIQTIATAAEASALADAIKFSRWSYSITNTSHVLGIAILVGAVLPMDLRLMGLWGRRIAVEDVARLLVPFAAFGLLLTLLAGAALFSVRAEDYVKATLLYWKLAAVALGLGLAVLLHWRAGLWLERATSRQLAFHGAASVVCWLSALVMGRFIAYFPN